ncbi:PREDICTED: ATP-dependent zinc metalloprotease FtsH-like [Brassica oleracea var. oleracea]|uniref:ATP-dependent zinc metalloprotease FtsH-like n=1 Tax=Brassica oleracea var. oleracea TaxID=109376 RepID=UPI0006A6EE6A|nr:PREDICTED: ATP-dependent zinc metalloprotease FtsH-like [Brassica oleracea var. oleracea]
MRETGGVWGFTGSTMTSLMFFWAIYKQFFPYQLRVLIEKYVYKLMGWVSTSVHIKFNEYTGLKKSEAYNSIRNYLSSKSTSRAKRLKANEKRGSKSLVLSLDDHEAVEDVFNGVNVKWCSHVSKREEHSNASSGSEERRYFTLSFHMKHREMIIESYLDHVLREGRKIEFKNRERKLYTNNKSHGWSFKEGKWCSVRFHHPATFETLAMDPEKKEGIKKELVKFSKGKDYYKKVGKPWKRGYLLFGPPGTGKSTMISAMANFLEYDVYDLELTTVKDNSDLKRLLLDTKRKSIIVIEDIDCSLGVTGQKRKKEEEEDQEEEDEEGKKKKASEKAFYEERERSRVTLSGLLNAIDGLWSACSDEKIMVFTTNFVENLDPALIRRGRMDNHIEMGYCRFEAFKVLAKNYLEVETHELYGEIERLVEEIDMSPADVAENLMPKSDEEDAEVCLMRLVKSLEEERENLRTLAEEEVKKKAEWEARKIKKKKKADQEEKKKTKADLEVKEKAADQEERK